MQMSFLLFFREKNKTPVFGTMGEIRFNSHPIQDQNIYPALRQNLYDAFRCATEVRAHCAFLVLLKLLCTTDTII